jgi:hypothetical protein
VTVVKEILTRVNQPAFTARHRRLVAS